MKTNSLNRRLVASPVLLADREPGVPRVVAARPRAKGAVAIDRRGVRFGKIVEEPAAEPLARAAVLRKRWRAALPITLPSLLAADVRAARREIARSLDLLDAIRDGGDFLDLLRARPFAARLAPDFVAAGASQDLLDEREIGKAHFDATSAGRIVGRDLFVKANWLSMYPGDGSIRLRFSFGSERLHDWSRDRRRSALAAELAERVFPECRLVSRNARVASRLRAIVGRGVHFPERIVYSNSPHGGAVFHHDFVGARQCGVVFAQLAGKTLWLALPKKRLAEHLAAHVREHKPERAARRLASDPRALMDYLEESDPRLVSGTLDADPRFFRRLVGAGHGRLLRPGDVLLLPSHSIDSVAWHSIFCVGTDRSLALSFAMRAGAAAPTGLAAAPRKRAAILRECPY